LTDNLTLKNRESLRPRAESTAWDPVTDAGWSAKRVSIPKTIDLSVETLLAYEEQHEKHPAARTVILEKTRRTMTRIGILHPGEMGTSVAAATVNSGHEVYWASENRSDKTRQRAVEQKLIDTGSLPQLCRTCEIILSVCPPHAAEHVAILVAETGFEGFYLDANAISPERAKKISLLMEEKNIHFVDGSIIGGPAWRPGETWLYLSGADAGVIANCFKNGPLETKILGNEVGKASALKMCYAAYSKGSTALIAAVLAAAEALGVREELYQQWDSDDPSLAEQLNRRVKRATAKAWRFEGEMREIAATFRDAGLPNGFHAAAAEVYRRMAELQQTDETHTLNELLAAIAGRTA
jgi:3-hydroxyisobutyrate dehydrogenase-like beta-hydroxyacid dehydrogenase